MIEHIKTPSELYLMWKDDQSHRHRVGVLTETSFRYLVGDEDFEEAKQLGFKGYPAFPIDNGIEHKNPISVFISRCQPRKRTGFPKYLKSFGLNPEGEEVEKISDFQLLAYTGAAVPGDPFNFAGSFEGVEPPFEFVLRLAGFKRSGGAEKVAKFKRRCGLDGDGECKYKELEISEEKDNSYDKHAIKVTLKENKVGYIPKGYRRSFLEWMRNRQLNKMHIFKVKSTGESPYLYAFVSIVGHNG